jgi:two-component system chemotaxis sensor kinase CheA
MDELRDQFLLEGRELGQLAATSLLALERDPTDADLIAKVFRAVHTIKGGAGLFDLAPLGSLLHAAEDLLDGLRRRTLILDAAMISALIGAVVQVERWLDDFEATGSLPREAATHGLALEAALRQACGGEAMTARVAPVKTEWARDLAAGAGEALIAIRYAPLSDCFFTGDDPLQIMRAVPDLRRLEILPREPWGPAHTFDPFTCNFVFLALSGAPRADIEAVFRLIPDQVELAAPSGESGDKETDSSEPAARMLRVPAARLDHLAEIVDEMMMVKNELGHLYRMLDGAGLAHAVGRSLAANRASLDRVVAQLHRATVDLRLTPLSPLLRRFPAMAREIADGQGKQVVLTVGGDALEVDKSVVDGLFEPLLHLVRNAVDHGIEPGEVRRAAGKPPVAAISLEARRTGDGFTIALSDDGRGIHIDRIRRTAIERHGFTEDDLAALSDQETFDLIFQPGFSTSAQVSTLSGRGVGMDAVRTAVTALGGKITVASVAGAGTTITLSLPFRIVMTRVVTVDSAGEHFGVPIDAIVETVRVTPDQIQPVRHGYAFVWRDRVVPLLDLTMLLSRSPSLSQANALHAMIVGDGDHLAAIAVDKFSDRIDVVLRPLEGILAGIKGISGTALTGDGAILLVLNPTELVA